MNPRRRIWIGRALALVGLVVLSGAECAEGHPEFDPEIDAGSHQTVRVGETAHLQGTVNATKYTVEWSMSGRPAGSQAEIDAPADQLEASFVPDVPGDYTIRFQVEALQSWRTYTGVTALPALVADAGADQEGSVGDLIVLEGTGSGANGDEPLSFAWSFAHRPAGSTATLLDADKAQARFVADVPGSFELELTVDDGFGAISDRVRVAIGSAGPANAVHVAPGGDDAAAGGAGSPLATVGEAFARIAADATINQVQVAAGVYAEAFDIALTTGAIEIVGPELPEETAELRAAGRLFAISGDASLTLRRVALQSDGLALVANGRESSLSLIDVVCAAPTCVESGGMPEVWGGAPTGPGGVVLVEGSTFDGGGDGGGSAVRVADAASVTILDADISGFGLGVVDYGTRLVLRGGRIAGAGTALSINDIPSTGEDMVIVSGTLFEDSASGIAAASSSGVVVEDSRFVTIHGRGIDVRGTEVRLVGNAFEQVDETYIHVGEGSVPGMVVVRNATCDGSAMTAVRILGSTENVDLGNELEAGGNTFGATGVPLVDERPADSAGFVTARGTSLNGVEPTPGIYEGPHDGSAQGFTIENEGNRIGFF